MNLSAPLMVGTATGAATIGRGCGAAVGLAMVEWGAAGAAAVGRGAAASAMGAAPAGLIPAEGARVGPPGGSVGSLMVGAAEGFGGKLMRTVSFLGCTLPVSFFGGG